MSTGLVKQVRPFSYADIPVGASIMIIGKRYSGKSMLQYEMMEAMAPKFHMAFAMSPTEPARERFRKCMPHWCVLEFSIESLETLTNFMKKRYETRRRHNKKPEDWLLVLDDTAFDTKFMKSKALIEIFMNGRNFGCTIIIICQYIKTAPPMMRTNCDFVFAFWEESDSVRKSLHENYFSCIEKKKEFDEIFRACTDNYGTLVHDTRKPNAKDWRDKIFWKRAKLADYKFQIGYPSLFAIDRKCFISDPDALSDPHGGKVCLLAEAAESAESADDDDKEEERNDRAVEEREKEDLTGGQEDEFEFD